MDPRNYNIISNQWSINCYKNPANCREDENSGVCLYYHYFHNGDSRINIIRGNEHKGIHYPISWCFVFHNIGYNNRLVWIC